MTRSQPLVTRRFLAVGATGALFMGGYGMTLPVLPLYVRDELGGSAAVVGLSFGSFAVASLLVRPLVGRLGDRRGRWLLLVIAGLCSGVSFLGMLMTDTIVGLIAMRLLWGVAFAAFNVGAMSMVIDLAPVNRRGEAAGYLLVANHFGIGLGPLVGALALDRWSFDAVWTSCAITSLAMAGIGLLLRASSGVQPVPIEAVRTWIHPAGIRPGILQALGGLGFIGFNAFVALYAEEVGWSNAAPLLLVASIVMIALRVLGRRLPDSLGAFRGTAVATILVGSGAVLMGAWPYVAGLVVATVVLCAGHALLMPTLVIAVMSGVPESERSSALSTFTSFQDVSLAAGPVLLGLVAALTSYRAAFVVAGGVAFAGLALLVRFRAPAHRRVFETIGGHP